jgi:Ca2+-binding EF-hand superfamily protein
MADNELAAKLQKQMARNSGDENFLPSMRVFNPYTEFKEFTRKEIQNLEMAFKKYDVKHQTCFFSCIIKYFKLISFYILKVNNDKKLDIEELKIMMEKLQVPQTHLGLKEMIKQVDEDQDNKINFKEVIICLFIIALLIFHIENQLIHFLLM